MDPERWQRVSALLQDAAALAAPERSAFLDRVCIDPDDRREIESLLHHHDRGSDFLEGGAGGLAADLVGAGELQPGQSLGAYRIVRELGRGGMGVVYLARDTTLERDVAIKTLPADQGHNTRRRERLRLEARAAAAVSHPGIAQVYALGGDETGASFVVSEYVAGRTFREEIDEGPLEPGLAVQTAIQIASAVAAAHARGIVHRDLKPENVMRAQDGAVKVLDFGLARLTALASEDTRSRLTQAGVALGTPGYMAPEQVRGGEVGVAADIFALGLMVHEMLTGRHAFAADSGTTPLVVRMLESEPNPLPPEIVAAVPGIEAFLHRCLQKAPEARHSSMAAVIDALTRPAARPEARLVARPATAVSGVDLASADTWWWQVHQVVVSLVYVAMIVPAWMIRGAPLPAGIHNLLVLAVVSVAALATTLRLHGVFTARVHPELLASSRTRARTWTRRSDGAMIVLLLVAAGAALLGDRLWFAALLATVAASATVACLFIEPATSEAVFGRPDR